MPEINTRATEQPLMVLLQAERDFPGYALDICSGYVSTNGILPLKRMLQKAPTVRAVVGLNPTNKLSAFQMLYHDYGVGHRLLSCLTNMCSFPWNKTLPS